MKKSRRGKCLVYGVGFSAFCWVMLGFEAKLVADATVAPAPTSAPPPMVMNPAQAQALGTMFGSCMATNVGSGIQNAVSQVGTAINNPVGAQSANLSASLGGPGASCPNDDPGDMNSSTDCSFYYRGNTFSQAALDLQLANIRSVQAGISCKKSKFSQIQSEIQCLTTSQNNLQQAIQGQRQYYQTLLNTMNQQYTVLDNLETDRKAQKTAVTKRLQGDGSQNGAKGLEQVQSDLSKMLAQINTTDIPFDQDQLDGPKNGVHTQANLLQAQIKDETMALTGQCFTTGTNVVSYQCAVNGPPCSAEQYLVARYLQNKSLDPSGNYDPTNTTQISQATASSQQLQNLLNSIFGAGATNTTVAFNSQQDQTTAQTAQANQQFSVFTPQDVATQFGQQLAALNIPGIPVYQFVMANFQQCYNNAVKVVNLDQTPARADSPIYQAVVALAAHRTQLGNEMNSQLETYAENYTSALNSLTGTNNPINIQACAAASVENKMQCITDMQANITGLLNGTTPNSIVNISFPANTPGATQNIPCQGVVGCVTALETFSNNLDVAVSNLDIQKKNYVTQANMNVDNYTLSLAASLSRASSSEQQTLTQLNQLLQSAGLSRFDPPAITSADWPKDGTSGLYTMPPDLLAAIGGKLVPPLKNLQDSLSTVGDNLSAAMQAEDQKSQRAQSMLTQIQNTAASCKAKQNQAMADKIGKDLENFSGCLTNAKYCETAGPLDSMSGLIRALNMPADLEQLVSSDSLESGVASCSSGTGPTSDLNRLQKRIDRDNENIQTDQQNNQSTTADNNALKDDEDNLAAAQAKLQEQATACQGITAHAIRDAGQASNSMGDSDSGSTY